MGTVDQCRLSAVIPVFNEEGNLRELHARLAGVLTGLGLTYEIVFVDDGSSDGSVAILEELYRSDPHVRALVFSRNFGHHLALTAGIDAARGEAVVLMDADLQDRPEEIPKLLEKLDAGYDVVYAIRMAKKHSLFKRVTSSLFVAVMRRMIEGFDINSGVFRVARRNVIDTVKQCRETHRFIIGLMSWSGFRQTGVEVRHGERFAGRTKYDLKRQVRLASNTMVSFSRIPLQFATYLGLVVSLTSFGYGVVVLLRKLVWGLGIEGWPSMMFAVLFLGGVQLLCLGILGEYVGRLLTEAQGRPLYVVARALDQETSDAHA
jgi:dolichol-phosphate mannosyltransferase